MKQLFIVLLYEVEESGEATPLGEFPVLAFNQDQACDMVVSFYPERRVGMFATLKTMFKGRSYEPRTPD